MASSQISSRIVRWVFRDVLTFEVKRSVEITPTLLKYFLNISKVKYYAPKTYLIYCTEYWTCPRTTCVKAQHSKLYYSLNSSSYILLHLILYHTFNCYPVLPLWYLTSPLMINSYKILPLKPPAALSVFSSTWEYFSVTYHSLQLYTYYFF